VPAQLRVLSLALTASIAVLACASDRDIPVSTNFDPLAQFPATATYVWDDAANVLPENAKIDRAAADALLKDVANEVFAARGYRMVTGSSDYRLSYQYAVHVFKGVDASTATGSLSLLLVERSSGLRVWSGFGQAEVFVGLTPEERRARLHDALERMLANFPPSQRPR
jgi:hypothetical protein